MIKMVIYVIIVIKIMIINDKNNIKLSVIKLNKKLPLLQCKGCNNNLNK